MGTDDAPRPRCCWADRLFSWSRLTNAGRRRHRREEHLRASSDNFANLDIQRFSAFDFPVNDRDGTRLKPALAEADRLVDPHRPALQVAQVIGPVLHGIADGVGCTCRADVLLEHGDDRSRDRFDDGRVMTPRSSSWWTRSHPGSSSCGRASRLGSGSRRPGGPRPANGSRSSPYRPACPRHNSSRARWAPAWTPTPPRPTRTRPRRGRCTRPGRPSDRGWPRRTPGPSG